jgi:anthranilate phosphoribosyltransferase
MTMTSDHAFAQYVRILGRGSTLSRHLTQDEARQAMGMILDGKAEAMQIGAMLLLLRYLGETPEEMAGFIAAAQDRLADQVPAAALGIVDLDWPSYADRHKQQPYFVLAALLLAENGTKVLMHGIAGYAEGYAPTRPALAALGLAPSPSLAEAARQIETENFAYVGLESFAPAVQDLIHLRPLLGVRTAVNSFARGLNPLRAPALLQGIVHPPYRGLHAETLRLLGQPRGAVFKSMGGEVQRNPAKTCRIAWVADDETGESDWPAMTPGENHPWREESLDPGDLAALWRGEIAHPQPEAAIIATAALGLWVTGRAASPEDAERTADEMWAARPREKY